MRRALVNTPKTHKFGLKVWKIYARQLEEVQDNRVIQCLSRFSGNELIYTAIRRWQRSEQMRPPPSQFVVQLCVQLERACTEEIREGVRAFSDVSVSDLVFIFVRRRSFHA